MLSTATIRILRPSLKAHSILSILLALLFFYNPYLTAPGTSGKLNVVHQTSYRANVASSELQHFSTPDDPAVVVFAEAWFDLFHPLGNDQSQAFVHPAEDAVSHLQFLCASLWFRPPPAV